MSQNFYTAFAWDRPPEDFHVTHKFLGELSKEDVNQVKAFLSHMFHFWVKIPQPVQIEFDQVAIFVDSRGGDEKVLVPSDVERAKRELAPFDILREELSALRTDEHPYMPHVSATWVSWYSQPFTRYVLMNGPTIIMEIPLVVRNEIWQKPDRKITLEKT